MRGELLAASSKRCPKSPVARGSQLFVYWAIFAVLALGALLNQDSGAPRFRFLFVLLVSVPTALMIGLRWQIGPDWNAYFDIFNYSRLISLDQAIHHVDPGFMVLNWTLHQWSDPFWVLNSVCGVVFVAGLTAFCLRQPNPWLAYIVAFPYLVIVMAMSGLRQSVALGFLFFALNAFERRQTYRMIICLVLAALFHGSALLMLPLCLIGNSSNRLQQAILFILSAALGFYYFQDAFDIYVQRYSIQHLQSSGTSYRLAMNGAAALAFLMFRGRFELSDHEAKLWRIFSWTTFALAALAIVAPSSTAIDRFLLYLFPLQFFVFSRIPKALGANREAAGQLTLVVVGYAALVQATFLLAGQFAGYYVPYHWLLAK